MQTVNLPNGARVNFPDGMSADDMQGAIGKTFPEYAAQKGLLGRAIDSVKTAFTPKPYDPNLPDGQGFADNDPGEIKVTPPKPAPTAEDSRFNMYEQRAQAVGNIQNTRQAFSDQKAAAIRGLVKENNLAPEDAAVVYDQMAQDPEITDKARMLDSGAEKATAGSIIPGALEGGALALVKGGSSAVRAGQDLLGYDSSDAAGFSKHLEGQIEDLKKSAGTMTPAQNFSYGMLQMAAPVIPGIVATIVSGGTASPLLSNITASAFGTQFFGDGYEEAKRKGLSDAAASGYGAAMAVAGMASAHLSLGAFQKATGLSAAAFMDEATPIINKIIQGSSAYAQGAAGMVSMDATTKAVNWLVLHPEKTAADYFNDLDITGSLAAGLLFTAGHHAAGAVGSSAKQVINPAGYRADVFAQNLANQVDGSDFEYKAADYARPDSVATPPIDWAGASRLTEPVTPPVTVLDPKATISQSIDAADQILNSEPVTTAPVSQTMEQLLAEEQSKRRAESEETPEQTASSDAVSTSTPGENLATETNKAIEVQPPAPEAPATDIGQVSPGIDLNQYVKQNPTNSRWTFAKPPETEELRQAVIGRLDELNNQKVENVPAQDASPAFKKGDTVSFKGRDKTETVESIGPDGWVYTMAGAAGPASDFTIATPKAGVKSSWGGLVTDTPSPSHADNVARWKAEPEIPASGDTNPPQSIAKTSSGSIAVTGYSQDAIREAAKTLGYKVIVGKSGNAVFPAGSDQAKVEATLNPVEPPSVEVKTRAKAKHDTTTLFGAIKSMGGINIKYAPDVTGESNPKNMKGYPVGLFTKTGHSLDEVARSLSQDHGFNINLDDTRDNGGINQTTELLHQAASGSPVYSMERNDRELAAQEQLKHTAEVRSMADEYGVDVKKRPIEDVENDLRAAIEHETGVSGRSAEAMRAEAKRAGMSEPEITAIEDKVSDQFHGDLGVDNMVRMYRTIAEKLEEQINERERSAGETSDAAQDQRNAETSQRPALDLQGQTEAEARTENERRLNPETGLTKAQIDNSPFSLTGETQEHKAASTDQGSLITPDGRPSAAALPKGYGEKNTVFTKEAADLARAVLKKKLSQLNAGMDPELMHAGFTLAGYHIESGARKFADFAKAMVGDLGDGIKPYLRTFYESVRAYPGLEKVAKEMSSHAEIEEHNANETREASGERRIGKNSDGQDLYEDQRGVRSIRENGIKNTEPVGISPNGGISVNRTNRPQYKTVEELKPVTDWNKSVPRIVARLSKEGYKSINEARAHIGELMGTEIKAGTTDAKRADEVIELAAVNRAREIVDLGEKNGDDTGKTYQQLVDLYQNKMPNLNVRTSTSVEQQAYSTPVPLAYVVDKLAGITGTSLVYEPTAGNGALLIAADPSRSFANELNQDRANALRSQGIKNVSENNAATWVPAFKVDAVVANPPFGVVRDAKGNSTSYQVNSEYKTNEVDHAIALKALSAMKDNGRAVLILGGINSTNPAARSDAYNGKSKRAFYFTLYRDYNVIDHFTVSGDMYAKQGAAWPVDVIVIDGRGKSERSLPAANVPRIIDSYDELGKVLENEKAIGADSESVGIAAEQGAGDTESSPATGKEVGGSGIGGATPDERGNVVRNGSAVGTAGTRPISDRQAAQAPGAISDSRGTSGRSNPIGNKPENGSLTRTETKHDEETSGQVNYTPVSQSANIGTLVPVNMGTAIRESLDSLQGRVGNIDNYVADQLGYKTQDLPKYLSAEQVDALALAIDNIGRGGGFIIGDQTGVGKGRIVAGVIRYAIKNGKIPIFVTEKPNLYGDMIRDLKDVGSGDIRPFMTNSSEEIPLDQDASDWLDAKAKAKEKGDKVPARYGEFLKTKGNASALMSEMMVNNSLGAHDAIFTTYAQMQTVKGNRTVRMDFLDHFADGGIVIFDESHNAGGTEAPAGRGPKIPKLDRASFSRNLVSKSAAVMYSSATYAKRPSVMDLYSRTDMSKAVNNIKDLGEAIAAGGVPLQQVVATMLAKSGQYLRRERSFAGVEYNTKEVKVDKQFAENAATIFRAINRFDELKGEAVEVMKQAAKAEAKAIMQDGSIGAAGVDSQNFTSVLHNNVAQLLLTLKAKEAVKEATEALKRGEKVVLTLANTMGSFIEDHADHMGLKTGDAINLHYGNLLEKYLEKSRRVTIKDAFGKSIQHQLTDSELGPKATRFYNDTLDQIRSMPFDTTPISPIDYIKSELAKAGFKTGEITGRQQTIDYSGKTPIYRLRPGSEKSIAGRMGQISKFNNGQLDAIILNQSGATGLSLHASSKFADQRQRRMIIMQAEPNIDTHMQMLGRVHRTGQVIAPAYDQLSADIPAEKRPAAVLAKKMASLNANTTANAKSAFTADATDFMNEYGDKVAAAMMEDNPDIHRELGEPLNTNPHGTGLEEEGAMRKVTGRIPMLPLEKQEQIYKSLEAEYKDTIERANSLGTNALEAKTLDTDAKTTKKTEVFEGKGGPSPFEQGAYAENVDMKKQGRSYSQDQVLTVLRKELGVDSGDIKEIRQRGNEVSSDLRTKFLDNFKQYRRETLDDIEDPARRQAAELKLDAQADRVSGLLDNYSIGSTVTLTTDGSVLHGVVTKIEQKGTANNPAALGTWRVTLAVADAMRHITLPLTRLSYGYETALEGGSHMQPTGVANTASTMKLFDTAQSVSRENRTIITGNLLAGYGQFKNGQIVHFTDDKGGMRQGILMPQNFDLQKSMEGKPIELNPAQTARFLEEGGGGRAIGNAAATVRIVNRGNGDFLLSVPASKAEGGRFFLNHDLIDAASGRDFVKSGNIMRVTLESSGELRQALNVIGDMGERMIADTNKDEAKRIAGIKDKGFFDIGPGNQERDRSNIDTATRRMGKFVDAFESGQIKPGDSQLLGETPKILQALGADPLQMHIDGETVQKILGNKHQHTMTADALRQLPEGLYNPLMVFDSPDTRTGAPGKLLVTEATDRRGNQIVSLVHLSKEAGRMVVNDIASAYGLEGIESRSKTAPEKLQYVRNEEGLATSTTPNLLKLAGVVQKAQDLGIKILSEKDIVNKYGPSYDIAHDKNSAISKAIDRAIALQQGEDVPTAQRFSARIALGRLRADLESGKIHDAQFIDGVEALHAKMEDQAAMKAMEFKAKARGATWINAKLATAVHEGTINQSAADIATWFVRQNPKLVEDLAISIRKPKEGEQGSRGRYEPYSRLATLFSENAADTTGVHEILHHLERLMPADIQSGISAEYWKQLKAERESLASQIATSTESRDKLKFLDDAVEYRVSGRKDVVERMRSAILNGNVPSDMYRFVNPSEFWAVNMTNRMEQRFAAKNSVLSRAVQWAKEAVEYIKGALGLKSDAPMLRAMDHLLNESSGGEVPPWRNMLDMGGDYRDITNAKDAITDDDNERKPSMLNPLSLARDGYSTYVGVKPTEFPKGESVAGSIAKVFAPATRNLAMETAGIVRSALGKQARGREMAQAHLMEFAKMFDKMPAQENYDFIDAMERGKALSDPKLNEAAQALRKVLDFRRDQVIALGKGNLENFNENYFPHIWQDRASASNFFSRRPLEGGKGFLKQRTYDYFQDGLDAGLKPVTTNPVELALLKAREMDRYIYGQKIFQEMKDAGIAKFVRFGDRAPDGWAKINDKIARVLQYSETEKGMILRGEYYAPEAAATVMNNHLSPGLRGIAAYDMIRSAGAMMNSAQLGFSAFHLGFTTLDAVISKAALGIKQVSRGDLVEGAKNLAMGATPLALAQPFLNLYKGDKLFRAYMGNMNDPDMSPIIEALTQAGGRVKMDDFYRNAGINEFRQALRQGDYGTAALKALPRLMDVINKPIFEYLVPRQKLGVFFDLAKDALEHQPDMDLKTKREVMGKIWDSVDNRMGELVYDNLFWNHALKDALMVSTRSVGWNLGTFREIGGGVKDFAKIKQLGGVSDRTAYIFGLAFVTAVVGSITQYLYTGKDPEELKDVFFPKTGKVRPDGTEDRLSLPSYMKDIYEYSHDINNFVRYGDNPFNTLKNKMHPLISTVGQIIDNKDFFGGAIRSPGDTSTQQALDYAEYMLKQMTPFSYRNYIQQAKTKDEEPTIAGYLSSPSMIGITPAPGYIAKNDEQAESSQVAKMRDSLITKFKEEMRDGAEWSEILPRARDAGITNPQDLSAIRRYAVQRPPKKLREFATH